MIRKKVAAQKRAHFAGLPRKELFQFDLFGTGSHVLNGAPRGVGFRLQCLAGGDQTTDHIRSGSGDINPFGKPFFHRHSFHQVGGGKLCALRDAPHPSIRRGVGLQAHPRKLRQLPIPRGVSAYLGLSQSAAFRIQRGNHWLPSLLAGRLQISVPRGVFHDAARQTGRGVQHQTVLARDLRMQLAHHVIADLGMATDREELAVLHPDLVDKDMGMHMICVAMEGRHIPISIPVIPAEHLLRPFARDGFRQLRLGSLWKGQDDVIGMTPFRGPAPGSTPIGNDIFYAALAKDAIDADLVRPGCDPRLVAQDVLHLST